MKYLVIICFLCAALISCEKENNNFKGEKGIVTDIDGNIYKTVQIGKQVWFAENLKVSKLNDETSIPNLKEEKAWAQSKSAAWAYYDNEQENNNKYGKLYNFYAVKTEKLCPVGWHVPTDAEWFEMESFIDSTIEKDLKGYRGTNNSRKFKATSGWDNNDSGTDDYGFSALPAGGRDSLGVYYNLGNYANWWTFTETKSKPYRRFLFKGNNIGKSDYYSFQYGISVRCIQD